MTADELRLQEIKRNTTARTFGDSERNWLISEVEAAWEREARLEKMILVLGDKEAAKKAQTKETFRVSEECDRLKRQVTVLTAALEWYASDTAWDHDNLSPNNALLVFTPPYEERSDADAKWPPGYDLARGALAKARRIAGDST